MTIMYVLTQEHKKKDTGYVYKCPECEEFTGIAIQGIKLSEGNTVNGMATGGAMGAAIGSLIPFVGTAIGGAVGGILGGLVNSDDVVVDRYCEKCGKAWCS